MNLAPLSKRFNFEGIVSLLRKAVNRKVKIFGKWSHSKLNAEKSLTLFSALFFYLFQGLKWEKRGDEW